MEIRKFDVVGAEVLGVDLSRRDDDAQADFLHCGLLDNGFLVIRDQHISPDNHIAFSTRFGKLSVHVLEDFQLPGFPEITCISNKRENGKAIGIADAGRHWHSDQAYERVPAMGSLLHAQEIPPEGGDTLFANMYAVLENMPGSLRAKIEGRNAIFNYSREYKRFQDGNSDRKDLTPEQIARTTGAVHPIIRTHPETGRKALYVSEGHTVMVEGMEEEEGEALLQELFDFSARPEFIHRHVWQPHDLIFWDNRCTMHNAIPYDQKYTRHMHRTTVIGDVPS
jgi:taurine dioxygenase